MQVRKIYIRGMVCQRCIQSLKLLLENRQIAVTHIELGAVTIASDQPIDDDILNTWIAPLGFSLIEDRRSAIVRQIKFHVQQVYSGQFDFVSGFRLSRYLSSETGMEYQQLSQVFAESEGMTLEQFVLQYRIDKVKERLVYTGDALSSIAFDLGFSSVAHLSAQFKQLTGLNTSHFRRRAGQATA